MDEASSTTGDDLEAISSEDLARLLDNAEPPIMELEEFRNPNLNIRYTRDMIPSTLKECSQLLLEVLVSHHDLSVSYKQLFGEQFK